MKKFILLLLTLVTFSSFAQDQWRRPFFYGGLGSTTMKDVSLSFEAGYWGIQSSTSFSLTYDVVRNVTTTSDATHWVGFKPYFTVLDNKEISLMVYAMPKFNVNDFTNPLLEFGFNPNYKVGNDGLVALTLGNQSYQTNQWSLFFSAGYIRLF